LKPIEVGIVDRAVAEDAASHFRVERHDTPPPPALAGPLPSPQFL
jgi:hypothetical protein